jgi:signal transduction histidine kinase
VSATGTLPAGTDLRLAPAVLTTAVTAWLVTAGTAGPAVVALTVLALAGVVLLLAAAVRTDVAKLALDHPSHEVHLEAPDSLEVDTDRLRMRQILDNLVDNACKFSPESSRVTVQLVKEASHAVLRVVDRGRGIPAEDLPRVTERFQRVEDPLRMTTSGAGLRCADRLS